MRFHLSEAPAQDTVLGGIYEMISQPAPIQNARFYQRFAKTYFISSEKSLFQCRKVTQGNELRIETH